MTFEQLFEKMIQSTNNGAADIASLYLNEMQEGIRRFENYNFLTGFIWALYGMEFISRDEKTQLQQSLLLQ